MKSVLLDGRLLANSILEDLGQRIANLQLGLCTILIGEDPASQIYVRHKIQQAKQLGINSVHKTLSAQVSEAELLEQIASLNQDKRVHGILVQLPLPQHIQVEHVLEAIDPYKDVDAFHPENVGLLSIGRPRFVPCTPKGCMRLIEKSGLSLLGKHAVVIGRSNIVGKPMAQLLMNSDATVTVCHRGTKNLKKVTRDADLLISATGVPGLIQADFLKAGAVVLDVGIARLSNGKVVGDVDFQAALGIVKAITPVPGGVGPMTLAMLMENTFLAHKLQQQASGQAQPNPHV